MATTDTLRSYAWFLMAVNVGAILMSVAGFFPVSFTVMGWDGVTSIVADVDQVITAFSGAAGTLEYIYVVGITVINGLQILIKFLILVLGGLGGIAAALQIPELIYVPIVAMIDAIIIYDFATKLLRVG